MKEKLCVTIAVGLAMIAVLLFGACMESEEAPVERAASPWPGEVRLWNADTAITQTTLYRGIDMTGSKQRYVLYDSGTPSTTGTMTITTKTMWRAVQFSSATITGSVNPSVVVSGCITVATGTPYYPTLLVGAEVSTGTFTPTIAVVAQ